MTAVRAWRVGLCDIHDGAVELVDSTHTTKGVILATYRTAARHPEDQVSPN
jgi:hypothetical protein